jgi:hypothetical protein
VYLAEHTIKGTRKYTIRISKYNPETGCWQCTDLYDLGRSPWEYIEYPGGNAFYIRGSVCQQLEALGVEYDLSELEELFWRFIKKEIRQKIEPFHCRGRRRSRKTGRKKNYSEKEVQGFDKRRMYYLRSGAVDQRRIGLIPLRYFKTLLDKSRDEIEQYFLQLEKSLNPAEYKQYVYVIFDLQRYFAGSSVLNIPHALDQDELDRYFLKDLCRMQRDEFFWAGFRNGSDLHEYLARYAVMFFDYEFDGGSAWHEYLQNFINSKRFYRPPSVKSRVTMTEVVEIFGVSEDDLKAMDKSDLTKLFRQKAHELHPDKGGEHELFVKLAEAYKELLRKKS